MSGTIDIATSAITSPRCRRRMPGADVPLRPERSGSMCSRRVIRNAGIDPHTRQTMAARPIAKEATVTSMPSCDWRGRLVGRSQSSTLDRAVGDGQARHGSTRSEERAFGQQLRHDARAAGAERRAQGDLTLARLGARQQQVRHVDARDQQARRPRPTPSAIERRLDAGGQTGPATTRRRNEACR